MKSIAFAFGTMVLITAPVLPAISESKEAGKLFRRAEREAMTGQKEAAKADYREAIKANPQKSDYHYRLAILLDGMNHLNGAQEEYRIAHQLDRTDRVSDIMYRSLLEEMKDPAVGALDLNAQPSSGMTEPVAECRPNPTYTREAARAHVQGTIFLAVLINAEGKVTAVHLRLGLGHGMVDNAINTVKTWRFKPATVNGRAAATRALVEIKYSTYDSTPPEFAR